MPAKYSLRVLLTNHQLGEPGGSEVNARDWAIGLLQRGHRPVAYAPVLGRTADLMRERSIPVVDDLGLIIEPPDIIHGSHTPTIIESIVRFPDTAAIQVCQGVGYPMSEPLFLPQVRKFIAVDETTRDYLAASGVPPAKICTVHNSVDLRRIPPRTQPLPARPQRALIYTKTESHVPLVREACQRTGIAVDLLGRGVGRVVTEPERALIEYDLIFATARSALEAIAAGSATIVMDGRGLAAMATRQNAAWLRRHNFGLRSLQREVTLANILGEIKQYDAAEATALSAWLRPMIDIEPQLDLIEGLYADAISELSSSPAGGAELIRALGPVLHRWLPRYPGTDWPWQFERAWLLDRVAQLDATLSRERDAMLRLEHTAHANLKQGQIGQGPIRKQANERRLDPPFDHVQGAAWHKALSFDPLFMPLRNLIDSDEFPERSPLRLLENDAPLGPAHAMHARISEHGRGSYSHWTGNVVLFSTSDNSDPNTNGREYRAEWIVADTDQ
jgi:hypothetical protein